MADNFDQFFPDWTTGTLTIASGSKNFTATNAQLNIAPVRAGDTIITPSGLSLIIATINANGNGGTLFYNAPPAAAGTFQTCIRLQSDNSRYTGAVAALVKLATGGNLFSLAGLQGSADRVPYFNGAGSFALAKMTELARNVLAAETTWTAYLALGDVPNDRISNSLPQDKSYRHGNVIGTVSQTGGVPTGYLMQRGSNANGEFARYADGTLECWSNVIDLTYVNGLVIRGVWTYPSAFVSPPALTPTMFSPYFYNGTAYTPDQLMAGGGCLLMQRYDSAASATVDITRPTVGAWAAGNTLRGKFTAIGRWF